MGIKRLLGQSPTGQLNEAWLKKYNITLPAGKRGDPPLMGTNSPSTTEVKPVEIASPSGATYQPVQAAPSEASARPAVITRSQKLEVLREIIAIVRPQKHEETRRALEGAGIVSYTTLTVLGRSRQRGLRFPSDQDKQEVAIKFLPKQLFSIVVEGSRVPSAVNAIVKANRTGKGQYGDGKIFVLELDEVVRVSTDERGETAV
jgi:nitrogen regulatory protein P-II 1